MPTPKKGPRLGGSAANQRKIMSNLASQLIMNGSIKTTDAKAKFLRPYVEKLITKAKSGSVSDRRQVARRLHDRSVIFHLFHDLAPQFEGRAGGYTRIIKLENRRGDNAPMSQISLVLEPTVSNEAAEVTRSAAAKAEEVAKAEDKEAEEAPETEEKSDGGEAEADPEPTSEEADS